MGKASRLACIIVPEALSVASLICLLLVFLAGTNKNDSNLRSLYYFKANTTDLKNGVTSLSIGNVHLGSIVNQITGGENISDFYEIYMWNYCRGSTSVNGSETVTYCSPRQAKYSFDPFTEWGLSSSTALKVVNGSVDSAVKAYQKGSQWMFIVYAVAFWVTVATIVVGLFAICSRVGSCLTTFVSSVRPLLPLLLVRVVLTR
jgi:SUR7/PalI family